MGKKIIGIVGSYRKDGIVDTLVTETLEGAAELGAEISKIYLMDKHIEFCVNCRQCTCIEGPARGQCVQDDDMASLLDELEAADGIVLGAPVNFFNVNALFRRFMERLVVYVYWPWGARIPKIRPPRDIRKAVLITSSAMPAIMGRFFTGAPMALYVAAKTMGVKPIATIYPGMVAIEEKQRPSKRVLRKARRAGKKLVS